MMLRRLGVQQPRSSRAAAGAQQGHPQHRPQRRLRALDHSNEHLHDDRAAGADLDTEWQVGRCAALGCRPAPSAAGPPAGIHSLPRCKLGFILLPSTQEFVRPHARPAPFHASSSPAPPSTPSWVSYERSSPARPQPAAAAAEDWDFNDDLTSNLPVNEAAAMPSIWTLTDAPGLDMFQSRSWRDLTEVRGEGARSCPSHNRRHRRTAPARHHQLTGPLRNRAQVFVILFGVGDRDQEGIYSLRALSQEGLPRETIIAFESEEDAQRYAGLLEATMEHVPNVCSIPPQELLDFCSDAGYSCRWATRPASAAAAPPRPPAAAPFAWAQALPELAHRPPAAPRQPHLRAPCSMLHAAAT
jgi:hypothetical protein